MSDEKANNYNSHLTLLDATHVAEFVTTENYGNEAVTLIELELN